MKIKKNQRLLIMLLAAAIILVLAGLLLLQGKSEQPRTANPTAENGGDAAADGSGTSDDPAESSGNPNAADSESLLDGTTDNNSPADPAIPDGTADGQMGMTDTTTTLICRIIDGTGSDRLLLAAAEQEEVDSAPEIASSKGAGAASDDPPSPPGAADVYWLNLDALSPEITENISDLTPGMLVEISFSGGIETTLPAQLGSVTMVKPLDYGTDNLCELYMDVLEDLWEVDSGLNSDIDIIGVDLSETGLNHAERTALSIAFGRRHGLETIQGTYQELCEQGYIDQENKYWENGCLFSITERPVEEGAYSLNVKKFDAQKWRSGLGAYFFFDCTSVQSSLGIWDSYHIGSEAIS